MFLKTSCFLFVILALGQTSKISTKGKKIDEGRIVGGFQTDIENFPYIASLQFLGSHICGCSIVTSTYAVTAAHCTTTFKVLKVRYGSSTHASGGLISNVMCTREHPLHNPITNDYDIAVVKIMGNFFDSPVVRPIPLCAFDSVPGTVAFIIGWGVLTEGGSVPTNLQVAQVPVITNEECQAEYGQNGKFINNLNIIVFQIELLIIFLYSYYNPNALRWI